MEVQVAVPVWTKPFLGGSILLTTRINLEHIIFWSDERETIFDAVRSWGARQNLQILLLDPLTNGAQSIAVLGDQSQRINTVDVGVTVNEFVMDIAGGQVGGIAGLLGYPQAKQLCCIPKGGIHICGLDADVAHFANESPRHIGILSERLRTVLASANWLRRFSIHAR